MEIISRTSPYIRKETSTKRMMIDVLIALIPVVVFSIYRFGADAIIRIVVSLVVMIGIEAIFFGLTHPANAEGGFFQKIKSRYKTYTVNNITAPAVSAIIFAMLVPSKLPLYAVVIGASFGILVGKLIFGGLGTNIFNPAAMGRIFIAVALTNMFTGTYVETDLVAGATALSSSIEFPNILNNYSLWDLFLGNVPGAMGEISALAILIGLTYLLIRRSADFRVVVSAAATFTFLIVIAGLVLYPSNLIQFVLFQLLSGGLLFGVAFMVTDPVTSPVTRPGRWIYGMIIAFLIVIIRLFGAYPEGVAFALLIGNMLVPLLDYPKWAHNQYHKKFLIGFGCTVILLGVIVFLSVGGLG